jgi:hypothetical protein
VSCHLFADTLDGLHAVAERAGLKRSWFQDKPGFPHYDLMSERTRDAAAKAGAIALSRAQAYERWKIRRGVPAL